MTRRTLVLVALVAATWAGIAWMWGGGAPEPASPPSLTAEPPAASPSVRGRPVVVWPGSVVVPSEPMPSETPVALALPAPSPEPVALSAQQLAEVDARKRLKEPPSLEPLVPAPSEAIVIGPNERSGPMSLEPLIPAPSEPIVVEVAEKPAY